MRILFALPYGPGVTRVRAREILEQLAERHEVTLIALAWDDEDELALDSWTERGLEVHAIPHRLSHRVRALFGDVSRPLQQIVSTSPIFAERARELIRSARRSGRPFDVVHVEHFRGAAAIDLARPLGVPVVYDAVDCLTELARVSGEHGSSRRVRAIALYEQKRTQRQEELLVQAADYVTVVAERDRQAMAGDQGLEHVVVVPNGAKPIPEPVAVSDRPRAVFTGKLSYHANQAAVEWLLSEIWPRVKASVPEATLTIAGAQPPRWMAKWDAQPGVDIVANPDDMDEVIATARVAVAPMVYSVGIQNKVLEAMAIGIPVVATESAAAGLLPMSLGRFALADDPDCFASEMTVLLRDRSCASSLGQAGHAYVKSHHSWPRVARRFEELYAGRPMTVGVA